MLLDVKDRLMILNTIPREGDFTTLKLVRKFREDLSFTEEEHKKLKIVNDGNLITWDQSVDASRDFEIGEKMIEIITNSLVRLNDTKKLTEDHFSIYEKFVGEK